MVNYLRRVLWSEKKDIFFDHPSIEETLRYIEECHITDSRALFLFALKCVEQDFHVIKDIEKFHVDDKDKLKQLFLLAIDCGGVKEVLQKIIFCDLPDADFIEILLIAIALGEAEQIAVLLDRTHIINRHALSMAMINNGNIEILARYAKNFNLRTKKDVSSLIFEYLKENLQKNNEQLIKVLEDFFHFFQFSADDILCVAIKYIELRPKSVFFILRYMQQRLSLELFCQLYTQAKTYYPAMFVDEKINMEFLCSLPDFQKREFKRILRWQKRVKVMHFSLCEHDTLTQRNDALWCHQTLPKCIFVVTNAFKSLGDLSSAIKLAQLVQKASSLVKVTIVSPNGVDEMHEQFLKNWPSTLPFTTSFDVEPYPCDTLAISVGDVLFDREDIPHFAIKDYDALFVEMHTYQYPIGLGGDAYGIFIDDSMQREITSFELLTLQKIREEIKVKLEDKKFYFGYSHYSVAIEHFIKMIVCMNKNNDEDLCVYIRTDVFSVFDSSFLTFLQEHKVSSFSFDNREVMLQKMGKRLTVVFIKNQLPHEQMRVLIKTSKDLCLVTKDQSFSEAVSANKMIIYELFSHKVPLWRNFCRLAHEVVGEKLVEVLMESGIEASSFHTYDDEEYEQLAQKMILVRDGFSRLNGFVATNRNLEKNVILKIKRMFSEMRERQSNTNVRKAATEK